MIKTEDGRNKVNKSAEKKKKRKREKGNNVDGGDTIWISKGLKVLDIANFFPIQISINLSHSLVFVVSEDDETKAEGEKKRNKLRKKTKRSGEQNNAVVGKSDQLGAESEDGFNELKGKSIGFYLGEICIDMLYLLTLCN